MKRWSVIFAIVTYSVFAATGDQPSEQAKLVLRGIGETAAVAQLKTLIIRETCIQFPTEMPSTKEIIHTWSYPDYMLDASRTDPFRNMEMSILRTPSISAGWASSFEVTKDMPPGPGGFSSFADQPALLGRSILDGDIVSAQPEETVDGRPVLVFAVFHRRAQDLTVLQVDPGTGTILRAAPQSGASKVFEWRPGTEYEFALWRTVSGLRFPYRRDEYRAGQLRKRCFVTSLLVNPEIDCSVFSPPVAKK